MELKELKKQLLKWVSSFKNADISYKGDDCIEEHDNRIVLKLYTDKNVYSIMAKLSVRNGGYLGAGYSCRKPRAGETWTRGGDLADGDFSYETWIKIMGDIIGTELVKIHLPVSINNKPN